MARPGQLTRPQRRLLKRAERADPNPTFLYPRDYEDAAELQDAGFVTAAEIPGLDKMGATITDVGREEARKRV